MKKYITSLGDVKVYAIIPRFIVHIKKEKKKNHKVHEKFFFVNLKTLLLLFSFICRALKDFIKTSPHVGLVLTSEVGVNKRTFLIIFPLEQHLEFGEKV